MGWDGDDYQARFDALAAKGVAVHGEADLVERLAPVAVLDAGCGTGRVGAELRRRGIEVVGVDADASMIDTARRRHPDVTWVLGDMASVDLDRRFDLVLMAGNVPLFTPAGTQAALVAGCARHLADGGMLVAGFQLGRGYELDRYDLDAGAAGLELADRWATWHRDPFTAAADYAVSVHRPVAV